MIIVVLIGFHGERITKMNYENVVFIHMESVNEDVFLKECVDGAFEEIKWLAEEGVYFSNCFSNSTSTVMSVSDFILGNIFACEEAVDLDKFTTNKKESIPRVMKNHGCNSKMYIYPCFQPGDTTQECFEEIFDGSVDIEQCNSYELFCGGIGGTINSDTPFFLYVYDWSSINFNQFIIDKGLSWENLCRKRFIQLSQTIRHVIFELEKSKKINNTLIVLWGDHGDDLYSSRFNHGFTHAIEPGYSTVKIPLIVWGADLQTCKYTKLFDLSSAERYIEDCLFNSTCNPDYYSVNYSISKNLFAKQKANRLGKGYSITDGEYMLCVSKKGLRLFYLRYACYRDFNLLNLFRLNNNRLKYIDSGKCISNSHYVSMIGRNVDEITERFNDLRDCLANYLLKLKDEFGLIDWKKTYTSRIDRDSRLTLEFFVDMNIVRIERIIKKIVG